MPRFVLLYHDCPPTFDRPSHWDLMLEWEGKLRTWALPQLPSEWASAQKFTTAIKAECMPTAAENIVAAERLADHRLDYLHLEGPLSGNRGAVHRIDAGAYETLGESPKAWDVRLTGSRLSGHVQLTNEQCAVVND